MKASPFVPLPMAALAVVLALAGCSAHPRGEGSSSPDASDETQGDGGGVRDAGSGGDGGVDGGLDGGGDGGIVSVPFDPVSAPNIAKAFSLARAEASKTYASNEVYFVELQGTPVGAGASYGEMTFSWQYTFAFCNAAALPCNGFQGVTVSYAGWTVLTVASLPVGSYLAEVDFPTTVPLGFAQILAAAAQSGVTQATCALDPTTAPHGYIALRGSLYVGQTRWFWEFGCARTTGIAAFDAKTGQRL